MTDIKKGADARQAVEGFAKKGKVVAFICGAAKMLEEKAKTDFKNLKKGIKDAPSEIKEAIKDFSDDMRDDPSAAQVIIGGAIVASGCLANSPLVFIVGSVAIAESFASLVRDEPALLERLVKAPKDVKNFVNKAMEKGGR